MIGERTAGEREWTGPARPAAGVRLPRLPYHFPPKTMVNPDLLIFVLRVLLLMLAVAGVGWLAWQLHGRPDRPSIRLSGAAWAGAVAAALITPVLRAGFQAATAALLGYRIDLHRRGLGASAGVWRQMVTRRDTLIIVGMPLVGLPLLLAPLLGGENLVGAAAFAGLVANTAAAAGDVYRIWRLLRMPAGTLLYTLDAAHILIYYPRAG